MSNVVEIGRSRAYLVNRAARHRRAGRYDEAMALLSKAKDQFGLDEEIELEMARVYEEIDCEHEAARAYLRVVRMDGAHKALALFQLALSAFQRSDLKRASSYYQQFAACTLSEVSAEMAALLGQQLRAALETPVPSGRKGRARILKDRAVEHIHAGKTAAALHALRHALALHPTSQGYTLLACCHLLRNETQDALFCARRAHRMSPSRVQTLCVLAEAYEAEGEHAKGRNALYLAALRAKHTDDLHAAAMESAKHGEDRLTLRLTKTLLKHEPFHTHGMMLRACALANLGSLQEACRLWGRLCGLLPEDSICEAYYRMAREGRTPQERLDLGVDVTRQEGIERAALMISMLYETPESIVSDKARLRRVCRCSAWALRSLLIGPSTTSVALILMGALPAAQAHDVLLDALVDPHIDNQLKLAVLQILADKEGFKPHYVDFDGRLVRLAAGGLSSRPVRSEANSQILQRACDALSPRFADAPKALLPVYLKYLEMYREPLRRHEDACVAALEYVYHQLKPHHQIGVETIADRYGVSRRLCRVMIRRFMNAAQRCAYHQQENHRTEE